VPVKWDFSDVEEKSRYYLENRAEREAIAERAFAKLHEYFRSDGFVAQYEPVYEPVSTRGTSVSN
jgi:spore maturation protein CgeB